MCQSITGSVECAMFGNAINTVFDTGDSIKCLCILLLVVLIIANLLGIDMFAKIQNFVAYGFDSFIDHYGTSGNIGTGKREKITQTMNLAESFSDSFALLGLAFFLFIGSEFVIPISKNVKTNGKMFRLEWF